MRKKDDEVGPLATAIFLIGLAGFFLFIVLGHAALAPVSGSAYGHIYYQEKGGIYQLDTICWKDTPYAKNCRWFDPLGKKYLPGKYSIEYECDTFVWSWERSSLCSITNATRLGE